MNRHSGCQVPTFVAGLVLPIAATWCAAAQDFSPGAACQAIPVPAGSTTSYCNTMPIALDAAGAASLYPSIVTVAGSSGLVSEVQVRLLGVSHDNTSTIELRLQSPDGHVIGLNGSGFLATGDPLPAVAGVDWTFADDAPIYALFGSPPVLNVTAPTAPVRYLPRIFAAVELPAPAPAEVPQLVLASVAAASANGAWSLWAAQDALTVQPTGMIAGGWCLDVTTATKVGNCYLVGTEKGSIDTGDPLQTGRIVRDGVPSLCTNPKGSALQNSTPVHYDQYDFANPINMPICVSVSADFTGCGGNSTAVVLYDTFDPAHPEQGVIGDSGYSSTGRIQFSTRLEANQPFSAVVHETVPGAGCPSYALQFEANACVAAPGGDRIFSDGFELPPL